MKSLNIKINCKYNLNCFNYITNKEFYEKIRYVNNIYYPNDFPKSYWIHYNYIQQYLSFSQNIQ
jgi:hypothetical protein